ncbi:hypothetical protein [Cysteiniphilum halobium]|uniref:hypothetical protein n=1 Tax=Cysteiniphilum halobium TaxID=2219059 RepID=UPI003F83A5BD
MYEHKKLTKEDIMQIENDDSWDNREVGADIKHASIHSSNLDNNLNLKLISCRLQKDLIDDLKHIALDKGINYQPLIRQVLTEYVSNYHRMTTKVQRH